ncbi:MAG TPA: sugar transferase [Chloroflexia bacterium]|nr:sugar transferase [Chloroflexia bacterium]
MFKRLNANYMALLFLIDVVIVQLSLEMAMALRYDLPIWQPFQPWPQIEVQELRLTLHLAFGLLGVIFLVANSVYNGRKVIRWIEEFQRVVVASTLVSLTLTGILYLINLNLPRLGFLYFFLISTSMLVGYRWVLRVWHIVNRAHPNVETRVLIVGADKRGAEVANEFRRQRWSGIRVLGFMDNNPDNQASDFPDLPVLGPIADTPSVVSQYDVDEVIIALPLHEHEQLVNLVAQLYEQPVRVRVVPDLFDLAFHSATIESLGGVLFIGLRDSAIDGVQRLLKRLMDIALSVVLLTLTSPVFLLTALAIKLEDGGHIFYKSQRVGENGRLFTMWKFRSMVENADKLVDKVIKNDRNGNLIHKVAADPRVTRVGQIIRRTSIDELPQLINVLRGDMSLVGPRPELPWMVARYQPWQRKRFAVPQGMTGWWQINGRSDAPMHLHTEHDLYYIQNYSIWLDLQILWKTIGVIFTGKGAY